LETMPKQKARHNSVGTFAMKLTYSPDCLCDHLPLRPSSIPDFASSLPIEIETIGRAALRTALQECAKWHTH